MGFDAHREQCAHDFPFSPQPEQITGLLYTEISERQAIVGGAAEAGQRHRSP
jgi:hypothetical protein